VIEFFQMGGHGGYVWSAYIISVAAFAFLYLLRRQALRRAIGREQSEKRRRD